MQHTISFTKMQGAGNDYIYFDVTRAPLHGDLAELSRRLSDRHFGIGGDGIILIGRPRDPANDFSMRIFNADGSEALMCGNGSRCVGKYVHDKGLTTKTTVRLETLSGVKTLRLHVSDGSTRSVTVDMGEPAFDVPALYTGGLDGGLFVSMGNPHFVTFVDDIGAVDLEQQGPLMEHDAHFPQRCNIEFAQCLNAHADGETPRFRTRVWERGSGITMACGTGACATCVAATLAGLADGEADIVMDGGTLNISWDRQANHVFLTGPAEFAFDGTVEI